VIPQRYLSDAPRNADTRRLEEITQRATAKQTGQIPRHVLVVEDSMIIAMDTEDSLRALGVSIVTTAGNVATAIDSINADPPDFAILDYNLGNESSEAVAKRLRDDGIPFVLATGYGELADTIEEYGAQALLKKPYGKPEIEGLFA
jgi:CheY-like chemotaxis protein